jgi:hypothetical protein
MEQRKKEKKKKETKEKRKKVIKRDSILHIFFGWALVGGIF